MGLMETEKEMVTTAVFRVSGFGLLWVMGVYEDISGVYGGYVGF